MHFVDAVHYFLFDPANQVGPIGLLYVGQREMAAVATHDKNVNIIGSDDATTCIIVVVRHSGKLPQLNATIWCHQMLIAWFVFRIGCYSAGAFRWQRNR